jgi:hypothetical protein
MSAIREGLEGPQSPGSDMTIPDGQTRRGKQNSKARTRTGCITCRCVPAQKLEQVEAMEVWAELTVRIRRIRRVKCDEARPSCNRYVHRPLESSEDPDLQAVSSVDIAPDVHSPSVSVMDTSPQQPLRKAALQAMTRRGQARCIPNTRSPVVHWLSLSVSSI